MNNTQVVLRSMKDSRAPIARFLGARRHFYFHLDYRREGCDLRLPSSSQQNTIVSCYATNHFTFTSPSINKNSRIDNLFVVPERPLLVLHGFGTCHGAQGFTSADSPLDKLYSAPPIT